MPGGRTRGQPHGAVGASPSLLALSACAEKSDMLEYQRSSALLERSGAAATKIDKVRAVPAPVRPPAYVCATCDEGGQGEKMETDGGRGLNKRAGSVQGAVVVCPCAQARVRGGMGAPPTSISSSSSRSRELVDVEGSRPKSLGLELQP